MESKTQNSKPDFDSVWKALQETDRLLKETRARQEEDRKRREADYQRAEKEHERAEREWKKIRGFMGNYGESNEEHFYRSLQERKRLGGMRFNKVVRNIRADDQSTEMDITMTNADCIVVIEVKTKAHPKDIQSLIEKKVAETKRLYPQHDKVYFGIASMVTDEKLIEAARIANIFLLTQKGDHIEVVNEQVREF